MRIALLHILLFAALLLMEIAFLGIVFPSFPAPLLIMCAVVVWTLILGFQRALFFTVPLTVLYDVLLTGEIQPFSAYMVLVAYVVSFLSRRLVVEHQGLATFIYAAIIAGAAAGYQILLALLAHRPWWQVFSEMTFLPFILFSLVSFWVVYYALSRFVAYIERLRAEHLLFTR